tara:strand:+ start:128 stop:592 length:465 start_codon:yes stop_codon:yes gene_type:complete
MANSIVSTWRDDYYYYKKNRDEWRSKARRYQEMYETEQECTVAAAHALHEVLDSLHGVLDLWGCLLDPTPTGTSEDEKIGAAREDKPYKRIANAALAAARVLDNLGTDGSHKSIENDNKFESLRGDFVHLEEFKQGLADGSIDRKSGATIRREK